MTDDRIELWFCSDCMFVAEIGSSDDMSDERIEECANGLQQLERQGYVANDSSEESGEDEFSVAQCDCCGSYLGGRRHRYALFPRANSPT